MEKRTGLGLLGCLVKRTLSPLPLLFSLRRRRGGRALTALISGKRGEREEMGGRERRKKRR